MAQLASFVRVRDGVARVARLIASLDGSQAPPLVRSKLTAKGKLPRETESGASVIGRASSARLAMRIRASENLTAPPASLGRHGEASAKFAGVARAAHAVLQVGRSAAVVSRALPKAEGAKRSAMDLALPESVRAAAAGSGVGEGTYHLGIKGSRLERWIQSHLQHEEADGHRGKRAAQRGGSNTWQVTHAPQITVVVNGAEATQPRKIAEQMVMALQTHHSELDQKLAEAWKRQAIRDERTEY